MGIPKAVLAIGHDSFASRLQRCFAAAGCDVLVVAGRHAREIARAHPGLRVLHHRGWRRGQLSSVRAGLRAALAAGAPWVLVHPVDTPRIRAATVRRLLRACPNSGAAGVEHQGQPGHPVVLSASAARRALRLPEPHLAAVLEALKVSRVSVGDPAVVENINTPDEYARVFGRPPRLPPAVGRRAGGQVTSPDRSGSSPGMGPAPPRRPPSR